MIKDSHPKYVVSMDRMYGKANVDGISEKAIKQKLFLYKAKVGIEKEQKSLREFMENY